MYNSSNQISKSNLDNDNYNQKITCSQLITVCDTNNEGNRFLNLKPIPTSISLNSYMNKMSHNKEAKQFNQNPIYYVDSEDVEKSSLQTLQPIKIYSSAEIARKNDQEASNHNFRSISSATLDPKYFQKSTVSLNNYKNENEVATQDMLNDQQSNELEYLKGANVKECEIIAKQKHMYIKLLSHSLKLENVCTNQELELKNMIAERDIWFSERQNMLNQLHHMKNELMLKELQIKDMQLKDMQAKEDKSSFLSESLKKTQDKLSSTEEKHKSIKEELAITKERLVISEKELMAAKEMLKKTEENEKSDFAEFVSLYCANDSPSNEQQQSDHLFTRENHVKREKKLRRHDSSCNREISKREMFSKAKASKSKSMQNIAPTLESNRLNRLINSEQCQVNLQLIKYVDANDPEFDKLYVQKDTKNCTNKDTNGSIRSSFSFKRIFSAFKSNSSENISIKKLSKSNSKESKPRKRLNVNKRKCSHILDSSDSS